MLIFALRRRAQPAGTYYSLAGGTALLNSIAFTLQLVFYVNVGLSPLELILVGTVMEATCFLFEIPTGVVADLVSRRLSIIIGLFVMSGAFLLQAGVPTFAAILCAQVIWGIGYTFTSGAESAWITDEIGSDQVTPVFTRAQQLGLAATIIGIVTAGALGYVNLRLPMLVTGLGFIVLAIAMLILMREEHFTPTPKGDRETFAHLTATLRDGIKAARSRPVVGSILLIGVITGLSSEAFDRLWTVRILQDFTLPTMVGAADPAIWFTLFALIGTAISLAASLLVNRYASNRIAEEHPTRILATLILIQVVGIVGLAVLDSLLLALIAMWLRNAANAIAWPIRSAWLHRHVDSQSRATVMSIDSQADAIGQVVGGPPLGVLANRVSVSAALLASSAILAPASVIYARLRNLHKSFT